MQVPAPTGLLAPLPSPVTTPMRRETPPAPPRVRDEPTTKLPEVETPEVAGDAMPAVGRLWPLWLGVALTGGWVVGFVVRWVALEL